MPKRWLSPKRVAFISTILGFIGVAIVTGIIGNRSDAFLLLTWEVIDKSPAEILSSIIALFSALFASTVFFFWRYSKQQSHAKLSELATQLSEMETKLSELSNKVNQEDFLLDTADSLLRLIPDLISTQDLDDEMHKIIQQILYKVTQSFTSNIRRCLLFLPDEKFEYLSIWDHYGWMEQKEREQKKFYVGPAKPGWQRGIAGEAFVNRTLLDAHITVEDSKFKCNRESYIFLEHPVLVQLIDQLYVYQ